MSRGTGALVAALAAVLWFSLTAPYGLELHDEERILYGASASPPGRSPTATSRTSMGRA